MPISEPIGRNKVNEEKTFLSRRASGSSAGFVQGANTVTTTGTIAEYVLNAPQSMAFVPRETTYHGINAQQALRPSSNVTNTTPFTYTHSSTEPILLRVFVRAAFTPELTAAHPMRGVALQLIVTRDGVPQEVAFQAGAFKTGATSVLELRAETQLIESDALSCELQGYNTSDTAQTLVVVGSLFLIQRVLQL